MVCVPCFIIPLLLWLWHRFVQPYVLRWWNPWAGKDAPFLCAGGRCALRSPAESDPAPPAPGPARAPEPDKLKAD